MDVVPPELSLKTTQKQASYFGTVRSQHPTESQWYTKHGCLW